MYLRSNYNKHNSKGFTLMEVMITLMLVTLVMGVVFGVTSVVLKLFDKSSDKIDAQSQFRVMMDYFRNDVGNSEYVKLVADPPLPAVDIQPPTGYTGTYYCIYIEEDAEGLGRIVRRTGTDAALPLGNTPYPLEDLNMTFSLEPTNTAGDYYDGLFHVTLEANKNAGGDYADIYDGTLSISNSTMGESFYFDLESGNKALYYLVPESYEDLDPN